MSTYTAVSPFAIGGSAVLAAAREVEVEDRVEQAFRGCSSPLALAVLSVARGEEPAPVPPAPVREEPTVNLTARWLRDNYSRVFPALAAHLAMKMPKSRELSVVEDHVQTVLTRFVERDTLSPFLRDGKEVKLSVLRVWAYQSASTELRRWGADASTRTTRGAKTAREVQAGGAWKVVQSSNPAREIVRDREDAASTRDLHDPSEASPEDEISRKSRVDMVRRHLARHGKPHLIAAVDHLLNGGSLSDLQSGTADQLTSVLHSLRA